MSLNEVGDSLIDISEGQIPVIDEVAHQACEIACHMSWRWSAATEGASSNPNIRMALEALDQVVHVLGQVSVGLAELRTEYRGLMEEWGISDAYTAPYRVSVISDLHTEIDGTSVTTSNAFCRASNMNSCELSVSIDRIRAGLNLSDDEPLMITEIPCSKGMETFSILAACSTFGTLDKVRIRAYDINPKVVAQARLPYDTSVPAMSARFSEWGLPPESVTDNFDEVDFRSVVPKAKLRDRAKFGVLDIASRAPTQAHVVVANNLLMHVKPGRTRVGDAVIANLARSVLPGGWLTVNDADTLNVVEILERYGLLPDDSFQPSAYGKPQFFRKCGRGASS